MKIYLALKPSLNPNILILKLLSYICLIFNLDEFYAKIRKEKLEEEKVNLLANQLIKFTMIKYNIKEENKPYAFDALPYSTKMLKRN